MQYNNTTMTNTVKLVALLMHAASAHKETDMKEGLRMTIDEMREKKRELGLSNEMISKASGVPLGTVQKIFSGLTRSPRKFTIQAIEKALAQEEGAKAAELPDRAADSRQPMYIRNMSENRQSVKTAGNKYKVEEQQSDPAVLREPSAAYNAAPQDSRYTIDDYYSISEDRRIELIDGVIYDMAAPSAIHQQILGDLYILFRECSDQHGMPCEVFLSPFDVRLDKDNYTMVQPDLLVICGEYDVEHGIRFEGAPDLVIEILSPSTRSKDQLLKLVKYENAGVREYWIVDPKYRTVTVHCFREEEYTPRKYEFESQIPVGISNGTCTIDFSRVGKRPFR